MVSATAIDCESFPVLFLASRKIKDVKTWWRIGYRSRKYELWCIYPTLILGAALPNNAAIGSMQGTAVTTCSLDSMLLPLFNHPYLTLRAQRSRISFKILSRGHHATFLASAVVPDGEDSVQKYPPSRPRRSCRTE